MKEILLGWRQGEKGKTASPVWYACRGIPENSLWKEKSSGEFCANFCPVEKCLYTESENWSCVSSESQRFSTVYLSIVIVGDLLIFQGILGCVGEREGIVQIGSLAAPLVKKT